MAIRARLLAFSAIALASFALGPAPLGATEKEEPDAVGSLQDSANAEARSRARQSELQSIRRSIEVSERRQSALREEIDGLESDRASLTADLIATAKRLRETEDEIEQAESRLRQLHEEEEAVRVSLHKRRAVMAEVLMALQRMGRTPPPAIVSRPEDALAAIRGSILAGAVLPDIRVEAQVLATDLSQLTGLSASIAAERDNLRRRYSSLGEEQARIDLLMDAKQAQRAQTETTLTAEREKATELASRALTLNSLIQELEGEVAAAAEAAKQAEESAHKTARADRDDAARRLADTSRIGPAVHFADAKGLVARPVSGQKILSFGESDGFGGVSQGLSLAARPGAAVLAPTDGWVVYAGPFRSYGQVLILNVGDGYHVVLAGMERIEAALGQFVLSGEPVAVMGATRLASIGDIEHTSAQPLLYVEFRKDGVAIDSAPWWAPTDGEVNG